MTDAPRSGQMEVGKIRLAFAGAEGGLFGNVYVYACVPGPCAGVDPAAEIKAKFLTQVVKSEVSCPLIDKPKAIKLLVCTPPQPERRHQKLGWDPRGGGPRGPCVPDMSVHLCTGCRFFSSSGVDGWWLQHCPLGRPLGRQGARCASPPPLHTAVAPSWPLCLRLSVFLFLARTQIIL